MKNKKKYVLPILIITATAFFGASGRRNTAPVITDFRDAPISDSALDTLKDQSGNSVATIPKAHMGVASSRLTSAAGYDYTDISFVRIDPAKYYVSTDKAVPVKPHAPIQKYDFKELYGKLGYNDKYFGATEQALKALGMYTDKHLDTPYYQDINNYLRLYPAKYNWTMLAPEDTAKVVGNMDTIFNLVPVLPDNILLFRGLALSYHPNNAMEINEEFIDKAYSSTTPNFDVAKYFAMQFAKPPGQAVFAIYSDAPEVKGILYNQREDEIILKHGTHFKVMDKMPAKDKYDYYLVQLCASACNSEIRSDVRELWSGYKTQYGAN